MRRWIFLLGGLLVWSAHFFSVYSAGSLFPGTMLASWLTLGLTVAGLLAVGYLGRAAWGERERGTKGDPDRWMASLSALGCGLAGIAILYQGLPGLLS